MFLTDRQLGILTFINRNQPVAQWEVSEGCNCGMVTAEKWCRELKSLGVITYQNRQDPDNSMPRSVMVTDLGREMLAESYAEINRKENDMVNSPGLPTRYYWIVHTCGHLSEHAHYGRLIDTYRDMKLGQKEICLDCMEKEIDATRKLRKEKGE